MSRNEQQPIQMDPIDGTAHLLVFTFIKIIDDIVVLKPQSIPEVLLQH